VPRRHCIGDESTGRRENEWVDDGRAASGKGTDEKNVFYKTAGEYNVFFFFFF